MNVISWDMLYTSSYTDISLWLKHLFSDYDKIHVICIVSFKVNIHFSSSYSNF